MSQTRLTSQTSPTHGWNDPKPARVGFGEWLDLFERVPDDLIERYHYYGNDEAWSK